ncbi:MAG: LacI family DNA-binding transcriptional regulator, partial [Anaerolineaceae bacterium]
MSPDSISWLKGEKHPLPFFSKSPTPCRKETINTRLKFAPYRCILISALPLSLSLSLTLYPIYLLSKTINPRLCLGRHWQGFGLVSYRHMRSVNYQHVTLQDVARLAGVSAKTVSRVVNHQGEISEDTRKRVQ